MDNILESPSSSSFLQWQMIFNALVKILRSQQSQLETLAKDRKLLQDRIKIQQYCWLSDVRLLQDQLSESKSFLTGAEIGHIVAAAKSDLAVGLKQQEVFFYQMKSDRSESDLEDFQQVVDCLSRKFLEKRGIKENDKQKGGDRDLKVVQNTQEEEKCTKVLQEEIRRLKSTNEKLSSLKDTEVSALLAERNFVWNQFKKMESDYSQLLRTKRIEVEQGNESIAKLQESLEQLQSSTREKDETIFKLKADLAQHKMDANKYTKEISELTKELELLRSLRKASRMVAGCPRVDSSNYSVKIEGNGGRKRQHLLSNESGGSRASSSIKNVQKVDSSNYSLKIESNGGRKRQHLLSNESGGSRASNSTKTVQKEARKSSGRKGSEPISMLETPRLFSSGFKLPKLKISFPPPPV